MGNLIFKSCMGYTLLDNIFIDEYMNRADSAVFALVYIYGLRCAGGGIEVSNSDIAEKFGILESEVIKAWKFWEKSGLVALKGSEEIEFLNPKKPVQREMTSAKEPAGKIEPVYNPGDIDKIIEQNPKTKEAIKMAENILGKVLSPNDVAVVVKMYDWLGMSDDLMVMLLNYCVGRGKRNMAYIEKVAMDWYDKNISTVQQAEEYLDMISNDYKDIMGFCGLRDRTPTKSQQEYMYKWLNEYKMPLPVIEEACTRATNNGKITFNYINGIIEKWHKQGIKTINAVEVADAAFREKEDRNKSKSVPKQASAFKNRFINYDQPTYSEEQLKEIMERKARKNKQ